MNGKMNLCYLLDSLNRQRKITNVLHFLYFANRDEI